jgi:hypothetical protein
MDLKILLPLVIAMLVSTKAYSPGDKPPSTADPSGRLDSLARVFLRGEAELTSPEFERRKMVRREFQRRGYAGMLSRVLDHDGLGALLCCTRITAQIEYYLPHNTLYVTVPIVAPPQKETRIPGFYSFSSPPMAIPLIEDRSFPADPWKRN